jgi:uncharacterized membrane protein
MAAGIETIAKGDSSRLVEPRRFLVRDRAAFRAVWLAHAGADADESVPSIDFDKRMVAAVFAGERPTPGYEIAIAGAWRDGDSLTITVEERAPDPALVAAQIIVSPFHIVSLPRHDGDVKFDDGSGHATTIVFKSRASETESSMEGTSSGSSARAPRTSRGARELRAGAPSSTGLAPEVAATMAYLAGPLSGALLLATERTSAFVRFHAWQAVLALGLLGTAAVTFLVLAFLFLIISPTAFWAMLWLSAVTGVIWVGVWGMCLLHAYKGQIWKLPFAGDYAERHS